MGEVRLPAPVKATLVADVDQRLGVPGAFNFYVAYGEPQDAAPKGLIYVCPCGCGEQGSLAFRLPGADRPSWIWDGNRETPTLEPSVHHVGHWHGYLRSGFWVQA